MAGPLASGFTKSFDDIYTSSSRKSSLTRNRKIMIATVLFFFAWLFIIGRDSRRPEPRMQNLEDQLWGQYTPYRPAQSYPPILHSCTIDQVNIIQRHGARYPTSGAADRIQAALSHLQDAEYFVNPDMEFLGNYSYDLGVNDLIGFGAQESSNAGREGFFRYSHLVSEDMLPFVRSSGGERCVLSATNWTEGFAVASDYMYQPQLSVIISEELNDTLDDAMCPNAGDPDKQANQWLSIYADPLAEIMNSDAPGANVTGLDVYNLISMCAFHSLAKGNRSPFCNLFGTEDFRHFEYSGDLDKYYRTGYGQKLGAVQGVGYINELIARLTNSNVRDNTQTNRTLDSDPETFPLNRTIYADFSHDNQMIAIYVALGLFRQSFPLDPTNPNTSRTWRARDLVPFAGRMVTERLDCQGEKYVRILVNDALQPLEFCGLGTGLCRLEDFLDSQSYARNDGEGDFERCFS